MSRMNYAIGCTDIITGETGSFGFDTEEYYSADKPLQFRAKTPVFPSCAELFAWAKTNNVDLFCFPVIWGERAKP